VAVRYHGSDLENPTSKIQHRTFKIEHRTSNFGRVGKCWKKEGGREIMNWKRTFVLVGILTLSGCAGLGPTTVSRDRFDYTAAISDSWKRQMMYNLVKIRYGDAPVFLDVSSVISQYQIAGQINLGATINNHPWSTSEILGAMGQYVDRPTITFTPIIGDKFARSLMSPIPPPPSSALSRAGIRWTWSSGCWSMRLTGSGIALGEMRGLVPPIPSFILWSRNCGKSSRQGPSG